MMDFIAKSYFVFFFSTSRTVPNAPFPKTILGIKSLIDTYYLRLCLEYKVLVVFLTIYFSFYCPSRYSLNEISSCKMNYPLISLGPYFFLSYLVVA